MKHPSAIGMFHGNRAKYLYIDLDISLAEWKKMVQEILTGDITFGDMDTAYIDQKMVGHWVDNTACAIWQELK